MSAARFARHVHQDTPATITPHIQRKGQIVVLDTQRAGKARHSDRLHCGAAGYEAGVVKPEAWAHIGRDMRRDAPPVRIRQHYTPEQTHMGWFEWLGHEAVVRVGAVTIVGVLIALAKGWI